MHTPPNPSTRFQGLCLSREQLPRLRPELLHFDQASRGDAKQLLAFFPGEQVAGGDREVAPAEQPSKATTPPLPQPSSLEGRLAWLSLCSSATTSVPGPLRSVWGYFYFRLSSFMKTPHHSYS